MEFSSDDEPIIKRRRLIPMQTARCNRTAPSCPNISGGDLGFQAHEPPVPEFSEPAYAAHLKRQSIHPVETPSDCSRGAAANGPQPVSPRVLATKASEGTVIAPSTTTKPQLASRIAYPSVSQAFLPTPACNTDPKQASFYDWAPFHEVVNQQIKQDEYQRRMEQLQTNRFISSLRRAVDQNVRNRTSVPTPNMHNLPNYAYNQTTKELARLHQQSDYVVTRPESTIHESPTHLRDHIEHHVFEFQRHRLQLIKENGGRFPDDVAP